MSEVNFDGKRVDILQSGERRGKEEKERKWEKGRKKERKREKKERKRKERKKEGRKNKERREKAVLLKKTFLSSSKEREMSTFREKK